MGAPRLLLRAYGCAPPKSAERQTAAAPGPHGMRPCALARSVDGAGLQTGDASLNVEAGVVVMTTEILRNMLYRVGDDGRTADERLKARGSAARPLCGQLLGWHSPGWH